MSNSSETEGVTMNDDQTAHNPCADARFASTPDAERFARAFEASEEIERAELLRMARLHADWLRANRPGDANVSVALDDEIARLATLLAERDATIRYAHDILDNVRPVRVAVADALAALDPQEPTS